MIVAQLTDLHVVPQGKRQHFFTDTAAHLTRAIERVNGLVPAPDAVLVSGDIADRSLLVEYERARTLLDRLRAPYFVIPGNHDLRENLRATFADRIEPAPDTGTVSYVIDRFPLRLVALDSVRPKSAGGQFDARRLAFVADVLDAEPERPTLIFTHHPPVRTGMHYMDFFGFDGLAEFAGIVAARSNVVRIIAGHIHREYTAAWNGTIVSTSVSTAPQYVPEVFMRKTFGLTRERPGFAVHEWSAHAGMRTRTLYTD